MAAAWWRSSEEEDDNAQAITARSLARAVSESLWIRFVTVELGIKQTVARYNLICGISFPRSFSDQLLSF